MNQPKQISLGELGQKVGISSGPISMSAVAAKIGFTKTPIQLSELAVAVDMHIKASKEKKTG